MPSAPVARGFDVEVLEDFDVEVIPDPAPPVVTARPVAPPPAPVLPAVPAPPAHDPFASFGPPPDSAAAKLHQSTSNDDAGSRQAPLHAGWLAVIEGLGSLKRSATIGLAAAVLGAGVSVASTLQAPLLLYVVLGLWLVTALAALVFHCIGLVRCLKMPLPEEGGSGRGLAMTALVLTAAGVVLAPCFGFVLVALPFVLGAFLRGIARALPHRPTGEAAMRFMVASGVAILAALCAPLVILFLVPAVLEGGGNPNAAFLVVILVSLLSAGVNFVAGLLYLSVLGQAESAVRSAIRSRGTIAAGPGTGRRAPRKFDYDAPTPRPEEVPPPRPSRARRTSPDDYNPFA